MFKKKSFRGLKEITTATTSSSPEPAGAAAAIAPVAPRPVAPLPKKKVEAPKPVGPTSIVPEGTKRVLVVGKGVVMTADVENCDAVIVQGNLDGNIRAKYIVIMQGGCMRGKVECEEADVAGSFEGMEMVAHHRLTLSATARVGGKTTYHRLSVHDGAILTGELQYKPSSRKPRSSAGKSAPTTTLSLAPEESPAPSATVAPEEQQGDTASTGADSAAASVGPTAEADSTQ